MDTGKDTTDAGTSEVSGIATAATLIAIAATLYLAIWVIDWDGSVVAPVGFCLIVSGLVGGITGAVERALRR